MKLFQRRGNQIALVAVVITLILDTIWIILNMNRYKDLVYAVQNKQMKVRTLYAILSYVCVFMALVFIAIPNALNDKQRSNIGSALIHGGLLGFVIYGIFNFTNSALFENYNIVTGVMDTAWGTFLFTITCYIVLIFFSNKK